MDMKNAGDRQQAMLEKLLGRQLGRREFMQLVATGAAASLLAGCGPATAVPSTAIPAAAATATAVPSTAIPAAAATATPVPPTSIPPGPKSGGILVAGQNQDVFDVDPHTFNTCSDNNVNFLMFNGLTRWEQDGTIVPDLAESWEWADEKTLVFALREGVLFHNGRECTADDVKFSLDRLLGPPPFGNFGSYITEIEEVVVEDARTVRLALSQPSSRLLTTLADCKVIAKESIDQIGTNAIGTGPFRLKEFIPSELWEGERFPDYFEADKVYLDGVKIVIYKDAQSLMAAMEAGAAHAFWNVTPQYAAEIEASPDMRILWQKDPLFQKMFAYDTQSEPFNDKRVRKAFRYATDSDAIRKVAFYDLGESVWDNSPFPTTHWAYDPNLPKYTYDLEEARRLLDEAGIPKGYTVRAPVLTAMNPPHTSAMEVLQQSLAAIDLTLELEETDPTAYWDIMQPAGEKRYPNVIQYYGNPASPLPDSILFFIGWNASGWEMVPEIADMAAEAGATQDLDKQKAIYGEVQKTVNEELPYIFTVNLALGNAVRQEVQNAWTDPAAYPHYEYAWLEQG